MAVGITPELEPGDCSICGEKRQVRLIIDNDSGRIARICEGCAAGSSLTAEELIEKHGRASSKGKGAQILGKEEWLASGKSAQPAGGSPGGPPG